MNWAKSRPTIIPGPCNREICASKNHTKMTATVRITEIMNVRMPGAFNPIVVSPCGRNFSAFAMCCPPRPRTCCGAYSRTVSGVTRAREQHCGGNIEAKALPIGSSVSFRSDWGTGLHGPHRYRSWPPNRRSWALDAGKPAAEGAARSAMRGPS